MSVNELKPLIQETVTEALTEPFSDSDASLDLHDDLESAMQLSLSYVKAGGERCCETGAELVKCTPSWVV